MFVIKDGNTFKEVKTIPEMSVTYRLEEDDTIYYKEDLDDENFTIDGIIEVPTETEYILIIRELAHTTQYMRISAFACKTEEEAIRVASDETYTDDLLPFEDGVCDDNSEDCGSDQYFRSYYKVTKVPI